MAAAAEAVLSLDVEEKQVAVHYWDDAYFLWQTRWLLVPAGSGRWIWATPDLEVQMGVLATPRVMPIARRSLLPAAIRGHC